MFTGIIKKTAKIQQSEHRDGSLFLSIEKPSDWNIEPGASIATNGVCLTVRDVFDDYYTTELMSATLEQTTFGKNVPSIVNVEPSLSVGQLMDGHIVMGHVDSVGKITNIDTGDRSWKITVEFPIGDTHLVVDKGSVNLNGVSLTVAECTSNTLSVNLVDYTINHTTFKNTNVGDAINIEYDIVGKYITKQHYGNN